MIKLTIVSWYVAIFIFLIRASEASADYYSAYDLYKMCTADLKDPLYFQQHAECRGYVAGVLDHFGGASKENALCLRRGLKIGQAVKIFLSYVDQNPEKLNFAAESLVENAIYKALECNR